MIILGGERGWLINYLYKQYKCWSVYEIQDCFTFKGPNILFYI